MFGVIPAQTPYDLNFRLLGIPVRVHPLFWLISAAMGSQGQRLVGILIWVGCVFVSILVHEFGHGLMAMAFGYRPIVVLYGMGGLCASEAERQTPWQRLAVLFAGPGAGFLLAALIFGGLMSGRMDHLGETGERIVTYLLWINFFWGLVNLFPVWPLDGGQIAGVILGWINRRRAMQWTHVVSLVTAGLLAVACVQYRQIYMALLFGLFAWTNFQALQAMHQQYARFGGDDDADSWRR